MAILSFLLTVQQLLQKTQIELFHIFDSFSLFLSFSETLPPSDIFFPSIDVSGLFEFAAIDFHGGLNVLGEHYPISYVQHGEEEREEDAGDPIDVQGTHPRLLCGCWAWRWTGRFLRSAG